jgi:hypothetical protein
MAKLVKILEEGISDLSDMLDAISTPAIKNKFNQNGPTRKFRPLTNRQMNLYKTIDANPKAFSIDAALTKSREMVKNLKK